MVAEQEKPFQLDPKDFKTGNILVDGAAKKGVEALNKLDLNHNKVPDISEVALVGAKVIPILSAINQAVDFEKLAEQIAGNPAVKDQEVLREALLELGKLAEHVGGLLPVHS